MTNWNHFYDQEAKRWYFLTVDTHSRGSCGGTENMVKSAIFMNVGPSDATRKFSVSLKTMLWVWKMFSKLRGMQRTSNHVHPTHHSEYFLDLKFYPPLIAGFQITSLRCRWPYWKHFWRHQKYFGRCRARQKAILVHWRLNFVIFEQL